MQNNSWKSLIKPSIFRQKFFILIAIALIIIIIMPYLFAFIQGRGGISWVDPLLDILPSVDLSWPIFVTMYSLAILLIYRCFYNPMLVYNFLKIYIPLTILRFILIFLIPLDPPKDMVSLIDPITQVFYGGVEITRDLFFSGHTSTMFLIYLILEKKWDKYFALIVVFFIPIALLFQHIHYTADVIAAFPITYILWRLFQKY
jgi:hypothetical protein